MAFRSWCEVDKVLAAATEPATSKQRELGQQANTHIPPQLPKIVAAAMLRLALAKELNLPAASPVSDRCKLRLKILRRRSDGSIYPQTEEEAEAWVTYLRLVRRRESLSKLKLDEGDIVKTKDGELAEVSSIGQDGRVFFKGGRGFGTWPDLISVIARSDDDSASAAKTRRQAENAASRRNTPAKWSTVKSMDLSEFATANVVSEDDIAQLEVVITTAEDERPIQKFLQENGHLLTALMGGGERYCIPQQRIGAEYVPDFVIGDVDSIGVRWVLIELETPRSGIYLKSGDKLDQKAQKGIDQVIEWRNWLSSNISYARKPRSDNGLGLFDIRENSDAVVIVGRRSKMPRTKDAQRREYRKSNIQIHSYDWLVETLRGAIRHEGPPGGNPYLISKTSPNERIQLTGPVFRAF